MKISESIKCPHCREESWYVFHDNTDMIECHKCNRPFDIQLETKVIVKATIPKRICCICDNKFIANELYEHDEKCPKCGHVGGHYEDLGDIG